MIRWSYLRWFDNYIIKYKWTICLDMRTEYQLLNRSLYAHSLNCQHAQLHTRHKLLVTMLGIENRKFYPNGLKGVGCSKQIRGTGRVDGLGGIRRSLIQGTQTIHKTIHIHWHLKKYQNRNNVTIKFSQQVIYWIIFWLDNLDNSYACA